MGVEMVQKNIYTSLLVDDEVLAEYLNDIKYIMRKLLGGKWGL